MVNNLATAWAYQRDFARRLHVASRPWTVLLAQHLNEHTAVSLADDLLADMRAGRPLHKHFSPMKIQKAAFKRAHRKGTWSDYRRFMDHLLNKWSFYHFHCGGGSTLAFVYFCDLTGMSYLLDLVPHDGNWLIEKRLVEIAVRNWPTAGIAWDFGNGTSRLTEEDLFAARKQGLNMTVNVDGTYYVPAGGALMSDGSSYAGGLLKPTIMSARRYEPSKEPSVWLDSPQMLVLGTGPDDPRPSWRSVASFAGMITSRRRTP